MIFNAMVPTSSRFIGGQDKKNNNRVLSELERLFKTLRRISKIITYSLIVVIGEFLYMEWYLSEYL